MVTVLLLPTSLVSNVPTAAPLAVFVCYAREDHTFVTRLLDEGGEIPAKIP